MGNEMIQRSDDGRADGVLPTGGGRHTPGSAGLDQMAPGDFDRGRSTKPADDAAGHGETDVSTMSAEAIKELRTTDSKRFWSDEVQARQLALIEAQQRGEADGLPADVVAEWQKTGGVEHHRKLAQATVQAMLDGIDEAERDGFMEQFDRLPEGVRAGAYRVLGLEPGGSARPASASALEQFAGIGDETAALVAKWGKGAALRLGAAQGRFGMMQAMMSPADKKAAQDWLDDLSPAQQAAVTAALAG